VVCVVQIFAINLSAFWAIEFFKDNMLQVLPYADYVFCNETEAETFGKVHGIEVRAFWCFGVLMFWCFGCQSFLLLFGP